MRKIRIVSTGWETFTGSLGHRCEFVDGESIDEIDIRNVRRIGASLSIEDAETGEPLGPAAELAAANSVEMDVFTLPSREEEAATAKALSEADQIAKDQAEQVKRDAEALKVAKEKELDAAHGRPVYSRQELEAVGANEGIKGLRDIAAQYGVRNTSITGLIDAILNAQAEAAAE